MGDADGTVPKRQVYMRCNGRPLRTSVDDVCSFFESCGKPLSILNKWGEVPEDGQLHERVLVTFKKDKAVEKALAMTGQMLGGREMVIGINTKPPKAKGGATGSLRVFVGNLPFDATEPAVRKHFASCGRILFVRYALDHEGKPKGFCHVIFEDPPQSKGAALHAALALNGSTLLERKIVVGAAPPQQKAKRAPKRGSAVDSTSVDSSHNQEREKKRMRPADWRLDRAAGLTLPRAAAWHEPQEGAAAHESW